MFMPQCNVSAAPGNALLVVTKALTQTTKPLSFRKPL